jgi:hypothetical protein
VSVRIGCDCWYQTEKPVDLFISGVDVFVDLLSSQRWVGFRLEGGISRNGGDQNTHGMGIVSEGLHHIQDVSMEHSVGVDSELVDKFTFR